MPVVGTSEAFQRTAQQFGLSGNMMVEALRRASGGTIDELGLMQAASRALILGVGKDVGQFEKLMMIARDRARVFVSSTKTLDMSALATRTASEEYQHQRAAIKDVTVAVEMGFLPVLSKLLAGFNVLPPVLKQFSVGSVGIMMVLGPLSSAFGASLRQIGGLMTGITGLGAAYRGLTTTIAGTQAMMVGMSASLALTPVGFAAVAIAIAAAAGGLSLLWDKLQSTAPKLEDFQSKLNMVAAAGELVHLKMEQIRSDQIEEAYRAADSLADGFKEARAPVSDLQRLTDPSKWWAGQQIAKVLGIDAMANLSEGVRNLAAGLSQLHVTSAELEPFIRMMVEAGATSDDIAALTSMLNALKIAESQAAEGGSEVVAAFSEVDAVLKTVYGDVTALANALSSIGGIPTMDELSAQLASTDAEIAILDYQLSKGVEGFRKAGPAVDAFSDSLKRQIDVLDVEIAQIDLLIKEKEAYVKSLTPQKLLDEVEAMERQADLQDMHARGIQREINAIDRKANAVERLNRPLERNVALLDLQIRRIMLASQPARRQLEAMQKIPGLSGDVIRAQERIVQGYDDQIALLQDSQEALQIQIDQRQMEADAIRETASALGDELDVLEDNTGALRDNISKKRDFIKSLAPQKLLNEIEDLKKSKDQLQLNKDKLALLSQQHDLTKPKLATTFDAHLADLQAVASWQSTVVQRLDAIKQRAALQIQIKFGAPGLTEIMLIYATLQKGINLSIIQPILEFAMRLRRAGASEANIASYVSGMGAFVTGGRVVVPPLQHGGIVNRPTYALIGEAGPEAVIPLNRALPAGMGANYITIKIEGNVYGDEEWAEQIARQIRRRLR